MLLTFDSNYLSIKKFTPVEIEDFTILTGRNGSGKSHLLAAIRAGYCKLEGYEGRNAVLFDYHSFNLRTERIYNNQQIIEEKSKAWEKVSTMLERLTSNINGYQKSLFEKDEEQRILEVAKGRALFELVEEDFENKKLYKALERYKKRLQSELKDTSDTHIGMFDLKKVVSIITKAPVFLHQITEGDFRMQYSTEKRNQNLLCIELSKVFLDYWNRYHEFLFQKMLKHKTYDENKFRADFEKINGPKPWEVLNDLLEEFGDFQYRISDLDSLEYELHKPVDFRVELLHKKRELKINFEGLSSGERVMFALIVAIYTKPVDNKYPSVLLLDEIDAFLHPSQLNKLMDVIKNIFINKRNMKVILATHSPTTIALAEEKSLFVVNEVNSATQRIEKLSKKKALEILTRQYASLTIEEANTGLSYTISKATKPIIFTEGITDKMILEHAWNILYDNKEMPYLIQDCYGVAFLKNFFNDGDNNANGIFTLNPDKVFIALFDFDGAGYANWNNLKNKFSEELINDPYKGLTGKHKDYNAYRTLLPIPNSSKIESQVITSDGKHYENNAELPIELFFYDVSQFSSNFRVKSTPGGGEVIEFKSKKIKFAQDVQKLKSKDAFKHVQKIFKCFEIIVTSTNNK